MFSYILNSDNTVSILDTNGIVIETVGPWLEENGGERWAKNIVELLNNGEYIYGEEKD